MYWTILQILSAALGILAAAAALAWAVRVLAALPRLLRKR